MCPFKCFWMSFSYECNRCHTSSWHFGTWGRGGSWSSCGWTRCTFFTPDPLLFPFPPLPPVLSLHSSPSLFPIPSPSTPHFLFLIPPLLSLFLLSSTPSFLSTPLSSLFYPSSLTLSLSPLHPSVLLSVSLSLSSDRLLP